MNAIKHFVSTHRQIWTLCYFPLYLICFYLLEYSTGRSYHVLHSSLDAYSPFCEYFIVPYFMWFGFIAVTLIWFFFKDVEGFYRLMGFLAAGMTLFLIVSVVYPNALHLRPVYLSRKNVFMSAVHFLWRIDTPTNVLPSLHVFNTLGCWIAIRRSEALRARRGVQFGVSVLSAAIILATLFLKQHSFVDVSAAFLLAIALYYPAFCFQPQRLARRRPLRQTSK